VNQAEFRGLRAIRLLASWIVGLVVSVGVVLGGVRSAAALPMTMPSAQIAQVFLLTPITVYRDPNCRCCEGWMEHLTSQGFQPQMLSTPDIDAIKQQYGVPQSLSSCHTAFVNGYVIEGHVPASDIQRLLSERSRIQGITVPGMPVGTPGMEMGDRQDDFAVLSFDQQGNTAEFNRYSF